MQIGAAPQLDATVAEMWARLEKLVSGEMAWEEVAVIVLTCLLGYVVLATMWRIRQVSPLAIFAKVKMYFTAAVFCACSTDKKVPKRKKAETDLTTKGYAKIESDGKIKTTKKKTLIFIRHGESTWNDTFNKSKLPWYFLPRLIYSSLYELSLIFVRDSWYVLLAAAALSCVGRKHARDSRTSAWSS
jgi:hypothetical protein